MAETSTGIVGRAIRYFAMLVALVTGGPATSSFSFGDEPTRPEVKNVKLKDLLNERLRTAQEYAKQVKTRFRTLQGPIDELVEANRMVADAELDLCDSDKDKIAALERFVVETKETERVAANLVKTGQAVPS